jgi:hypothetical protein
VLAFKPALAREFAGDREPTRGFVIGISRLDQADLFSEQDADPVSVSPVGAGLARLG